jgi:hypothetical protein
LFDFAFDFKVLLPKVSCSAVSTVIGSCAGMSGSSAGISSTSCVSLPFKAVTRCALLQAATWAASRPRPAPAPSVL